MEKSRSATPEPRAGTTWQRLEEFVRAHVQRFIQALLEEEVTELLGRTKSARREAVDAGIGSGLNIDLWSCLLQGQASQAVVALAKVRTHA